MAKDSGRICFSATAQTRKQLDDLKRVESIRTRGELIRVIIRDAHKKATEKK